MLTGTGAPATWVVALLVGVLLVSPLAVGAVNRRFQKRERQPARGVTVGRRALGPAEAAYLQSLKRDVQTYQQTRRRKFVTGYVARIGDDAVVCRTYRLGRQGSYVGIARMGAPTAAPTAALEFRAHPLHLLLRVLVLLVVAALALLLDVPWWVALILVGLVAWVFWFDHNNEIADQLAHLRTVMQQQSGQPARATSIPQTKGASRKS